MKQLVQDSILISSYFVTDVLLQQNDNHIERTIDVIFTIDEDSEPVVPG